MGGSCSIQQSNNAPVDAKSEAKKTQQPDQQKTAPKVDAAPKTEKEVTTKEPDTRPKLNFDEVFQGNDLAYLFLLKNHGQYIMVEPLADFCNMDDLELKQRIARVIASGLVERINEEDPEEDEGCENDDDITCVRMKESEYKKRMKSAPEKLQLPQCSTLSDVRFKLLAVIAKNSFQEDLDDINLVLRLLQKAVDLKQPSFVVSVLRQFEPDFFKQFQSSKIIAKVVQKPAKGRLKTTLLATVCEHNLGRALVELVYKLWPNATQIVDDEGNYPLHLAVKSGDFLVVAFIYEMYPAALGCTNDKMETALLVATGTPGNIEIGKFLTEKSAPAGIKTADKYNFLPLRSAAEFADLETVEYLYEKWTQACDKTDATYGRNPLAGACASGNEKVAFFLASQCSETCSQRDNDNNTPLHLLLKNEKPSVELCRFFIEKYPEWISVKTEKKERNALHLIIEETMDEDSETEKLRARGEWDDPNEASNFPAQKFSLVKQMAEVCPEAIKDKNVKWLTPLHLAFEKENKAIFRYLAEKCPEGLTVAKKLPIKKQNTILHDIAEGSEDNWVWVHFITDLCPETANIRNHLFQTPLGIAKHKGRRHFADRYSKKVVPGDDATPPEFSSGASNAYDSDSVDSAVSE